MANEQSRLSAHEPAPLIIDQGAPRLAEIVVFVDGQTEATGSWSSQERWPRSTVRASSVSSYSGAHNYPGGNVRPRKRHAEHDRGAPSAT